MRNILIIIPTSSA